MRLRIILAGVSAGTSSGVNAREQQIIRWLRSMGHDALAYRGCAIGSTPPDTGILRHFPVDAAVADDHRARSSAMLKTLRREQPDVLVLRGSDYEMIQTATRIMRNKTAVISVPGGEVAHPKIDHRVDFLFEEYPGQADAFLSRFKRLKGRAVMPKWIDWDAVAEAVREAKTFDVINVGSLGEKRKNQGALLPLAERWTLCFVGDGEFRADLEARGKEKPIPPVFAGEVALADVYRWMARARLMVHSSTYEGLPRVVMEAAAVGVPAIGLTTAFKRFVPPHAGLVLVSPDALVDAANELLDDEARLREMAAAARAYAADTMRPGRIEQEFAAAIEVVLPGAVTAGNREPRSGRLRRRFRAR